MMKRNKRRIRFLAVLCCLTLFISGCGKGDDSGASTAAQTETVSSGDTETAPAETGATESETYQQVEETVYVKDPVNVRKEATSESESLGVLQTGESVKRVGIGSVWSQVEYNGQICYVASQYLTTEPVASSAPSTEASSAEAQAISTGAAFPEPAEALSNEAIPYGNNENDRDALNRPNGVFYYEKLYGYYADFIGPNTNTIYLTMDEGYEAGFTPTILDTLKEKNVKATFFITKQFFDSDPELIQRMIDEGHAIGNHTCAHPSGGVQQLGIQGQQEDIMKLHNLVLEKFGYNMTLFRYPEGTFSKQSLKVVNDLGYRPIFWSFAHVDWNLNDQPDPAETLQKCLNSLHPGAIYLLHAESSTNTQILGDFIDGARARGYEFAAVPPTGLNG